MQKKHISKLGGCLALLGLGVVAFSANAQSSYYDRFGNSPSEQQAPEAYRGNMQSPSDMPSRQLDDRDTGVAGDRYNQDYDASRGARGPVRSDVTYYSADRTGNWGNEGYLRWQLENTNSP